VKIVADTNLLVRAITEDDAAQARKAQATLRGAELVAVATTSLCELVWVLLRLYGISRNEVSAAIRKLTDSANLVVHRAAVDAGLAVLDAGGDFADGIIAFEGLQLGCDTFVSFDKSAAKILQSQGHRVRLLT
jgi:predicted nucleic-acid-binding protein